MSAIKEYIKGKYYSHVKHEYSIFAKKIMKKCNHCNEAKELTEFVKHKDCRDGISNTCKSCKLEKQRKYREINNNICTKAYEKTPRGFLMRTYRNMVSRISGIQKNKAHLYYGKNILNKEIFYVWSLQSTEFNSLYKNWVKSNYNRKLTPSIDRINSKLGYILENMQWITHSENSRKTSRNKIHS